MYLQRKIDLLFVLALLIFGGLFYAALQSSDYSRQSSQLLRQTQEILYHLERVESSISSIEASHRGYVITGNEEYLIPFSYAKEDMEASLNFLDTLLDYKQSENLELLKRLIDRKIEFSQMGVQLRRQYDRPDTALSLVSSGRGRLLMDSIRLLSKEMERQEIIDLQDRTNENRASVIEQNHYFLLLSSFTILVLAFLYRHVRRNAKTLLQYRRTQDELIKELNYQNRQLDDFANLTSHNLRSPAKNIYTLISLIDEKSTIEDFKNIYDKLAKVSRNLDDTLSDLVEVLQVKKNVDIERELISLQEVLDQVTDAMQGDIMVTGAKIESDFSQAPQIVYPRVYLVSIFHNLMSNALKYSSPQRKPVIRIVSFKDGEQFGLRFSDNGLGIDLKRYGHQVFGLKKTFHRNAHAKGTGLFMTRTQIETLGGEISIESEVNKGSTFTVIFNKAGQPLAFSKPDQQTVVPA